MRRFIHETNAIGERIETIVEVLRRLMLVDMFRAVLKEEGLVTMPAELAERIAGSRGFSAREKPEVASNVPLIAGICPEAIGLLENFGVHPKILGLLKKGTPIRQVEVAKLMVALDRVTFISARVIIALTPQAQLADPSIPRQQFFGIDTETFAGMELEFAALSREFLDANECRGVWSLQLVAAGGYLHRLMDNLKVVRYLAGNYPNQFETLHRLLEPAF
jgi:hypothetical protein